jgi:uncharacterized coiled-coil protein SlyX
MVVGSGAIVVVVGLMFTITVWSGDLQVQVSENVRVSERLAAVVTENQRVVERLTVVVEKLTDINAENAEDQIREDLNRTLCAAGDARLIYCQRHNYPHPEQP